jgi:hypothetical protein
VRRGVGKEAMGILRRNKDEEGVRERYFFKGGRVVKNTFKKDQKIKVVLFTLLTLDMMAYMQESGIRVTDIFPPTILERERASLWPSREGDASAIIT